MTRIGQILSKNVPLSAHDIEEICEEQKATRSCFGDAALALGVVRPEHVWQAWIEQIQGEDVEIDLDALGVDSQAVAHLPADVAHEFGVVPVRVHKNEIVLASARKVDQQTLLQIQAQCEKNIVIAIARGASVEREIARHYASTGPSAASVAA